MLKDDPDLRIERTGADGRHGLSLLPHIYIERGTKDDWDLLHELHYKAEKLGIGPKVWRAVLDGQVIGVGIMTVPKMLLSGRNKILPHMRPNTGGRDTKLINRHRALWLNAHTCTNSRLVLDTMYRGAGIAYRMQNLMMRMTACRYVEFQSSMSKYNPFAGKAGMRFTKPSRSSNYERGLNFFSRWFTSVPMDYVGIQAEVDAMPPAIQRRCVEEMRKFYYTCSAMEKSGDNRANGTSRVDAMKVDYLIKSLQQLVLASPLYGLFDNPDFGIVLPERLPLIAFNNQSLTEPLDLARAAAQMSVIDARTELVGRDWIDTAWGEDDE